MKFKFDNISRNGFKSHLRPSVAAPAAVAVPGQYAHGNVSQDDQATHGQALGCPVLPDGAGGEAGRRQTFLQRPSSVQICSRFVFEDVN